MKRLLGMLLLLAVIASGCTRWEIINDLSQPATISIGADYTHTRISLRPGEKRTVRLPDFSSYIIVNMGQTVWGFQNAGIKDGTVRMSETDWVFFPVDLYFPPPCETTVWSYTRTRPDRDFQERVPRIRAVHCAGDVCYDGDTTVTFTRVGRDMGVSTMGGSKPIWVGGKDRWEWVLCDVPTDSFYQNGWRCYGDFCWNGRGYGWQMMESGLWLFYQRGWSRPLFPAPSLCAVIAVAIALVVGFIVLLNCAGIKSLRQRKSGSVGGGE